MRLCSVTSLCGATFRPQLAESLASKGLNRDSNRKLLADTCQRIADSPLIAKPKRDDGAERGPRTLAGGACPRRKKMRAENICGP